MARVFLTDADLVDENAELRARLENAEAARRDAQESRFALIVQNEELGAELADIRARLESAGQIAAKLADALDWAAEGLSDYSAKTRLRRLVDEARAALAARAVGTETKE